MQNKLQELTDKLYNEGLSKGQQDADNLLAKTREEVKKMLDNAKEEAKQIINKANKDAEDVKKNADAEIRLAGRQMVEQVKRSIEETLMTKAITEPTKTAFNDTDFIKEVIKTAIGQFSPDSENSIGLAVLLPEDKKKDLNDFTADKIQKLLKNGVDIQYSKTVKEGFRIGLKDKGYYISFTGNDFENLFKEYLRPTVQELLFSK
ncbi:MAG: hypothetical protein LBG19_10315 [Prevotellaceae bacterium]|jgi:V/A-type H+-transporting ATPase subunit E|nr:hypothetical protein [Prevotellaceae bacterium]